MPRIVDITDPLSGTSRGRSSYPNSQTFGHNSRPRRVRLERINRIELMEISSSFWDAHFPFTKLDSRKIYGPHP